MNGVYSTRVNTKEIKDNVGVRGIDSGKGKEGERDGLCPPSLFTSRYGPKLTKPNARLSEPDW